MSVRALRISVTLWLSVNKILCLGVSVAICLRRRDCSVIQMGAYCGEGAVFGGSGFSGSALIGSSFSRCSS
jgi:hypothetical protein